MVNISNILTLKNKYNELLQKQSKYIKRIANICKDLEDKEELIKALQLEQEFYLEIQNTKQEIENILEQLKNLKENISSIEILKGFDING